MRYPTNLIFELRKNEKSKARHFDFFKKHIGLRIFVNFKENDCRSGMAYRIEAMNDYGRTIEFKLIRSDHNGNN